MKVKNIALITFGCTLGLPIIAASILLIGLARLYFWVTASE